MPENELIKQVYAADKQRFTLLKYFHQQKQCDYIFSVIAGANILYNVPPFTLVKREDIHFGKYADYGPDLFVWGAHVSINNQVGYRQGLVYSPVTPGVHSGENHGMSGYMCIAGSDFPAKGKVERVSLLHIAPTIMNILRLEIPYMMEKPSLLSMFEKRRKITIQESEEDATVRSHLEALGY